tara:strand:- start:86 stop:985 length:900 start_codon:yes stop_codon:yes gene_type:complete
MSDPKGFYSSLELEPGALPEDIKKAYRRLSLAYHPDRNPNDATATAKFQKISEAYQVLEDPTKKQQYDMAATNPFVQMGFAGNTGGINPEDIINNLFANGMFGGKAHIFHMGGPIPNSFAQKFSKPAPIIKKITISLEQSFTGCNIPIEVERWVEGARSVREKETLYVPIPRGIDDNEIIVLKDKGNSLSDSNKGDIKVFVSVRNDTEFERNGLDLLYNKVITLKEALCGFKFDLNYIDGRTFRINNDNGNVITPNYKKLIPKLGITREKHQGNLIIAFTVTFPDSLTREQIDEIKKII